MLLSAGYLSSRLIDRFPIIIRTIVLELELFPEWKRSVNRHLHEPGIKVVSANLFLFPRAYAYGPPEEEESQFSRIYDIRTSNGIVLETEECQAVEVSSW